MKPKPEHITALIDTREQNLLDLAPLRTERATLATGDYTIKGLEHVVAVERKSESDLLACCGRYRKRFGREIQRLLAYPVRALVVESSWEAMEIGAWRSKLTSDQVIGSLLGWQAAGVSVFMVGNHERAGRYVSRLLYIVARRRLHEAHSLMAAHGEIRKSRA